MKTRIFILLLVAGLCMTGVASLCKDDQEWRCDRGGCGCRLSKKKCQRGLTRVCFWGKCECVSPERMNECKEKKCKWPYCYTEKQCQVGLCQCTDRKRIIK